MIPVPQPVLEALAESFGAKAAHLRHFGGGQESSDGIVYDYPYEDERRLLKILPIPVGGQRVGLFCLEERLQFVRFLGENGTQIVFPQFSPQGNLYETFPFEKHLWVGYSMDVAPGIPMLEKTWNPEFFKNWGQTVGMLHRLTQEYPSWKSSVDPETGDDLLTWRGEWQTFYDWIQDDDVRGKWVELEEQLDTFPITRESFGFIHNDPHIWNLLVDGNRITLLDFDVANHHWFITDISIACQNILAFMSGGMAAPVHDRDKLLSFLGFFLEGYERENRLTPEWLNRLDVFIAYRRILLFTVMNEWIKSQPDLHKTWKQMILTQPEVAGHFSTGTD